MAYDKDPVATSGGTGDRNVRNNFNKIVGVILLITALAILGGWLFVRAHGDKTAPLQKTRLTLSHSERAA